MQKVFFDFKKLFHHTPNKTNPHQIERQSNVSGVSWKWKAFLLFDLFGTVLIGNQGVWKRF